MAEQESPPVDSGDEAAGQIAVAEAPDASPEASEPADQTPELAAASIQPGEAPSEPGEDGEEQQGLLGELARAMHTAAESQYERISAELERRRAEQIEAIAARASAHANDLKMASANDISAIDAWALAETEKIKVERLRRIDLRREQLADELQRQETIREREVFAVQVAVDAHGTELDGFFDRLEHESDPARIAEVASTLPAIPPLPDIAEEARRGASAEFASLDEAAATRGDAQDREASVSESRLTAVMDPAASNGATSEVARPWESEPYAITVPAGPRVAREAEPRGRVGSTLLRAIPSIRPMGGRRNPGGEEPDERR